MNGSKPLTSAQKFDYSFSSSLSENDDQLEEVDMPENNSPLNHEESPSEDDEVPDTNNLSQAALSAIQRSQRKDNSFDRIGADSEDPVDCDSDSSADLQRSKLKTLSQGKSG